MSGNHVKQSILSPEEVVLDGWYSFNLNPQQQHELEATPIARWNKTYQEIQSLISIFIPYAEIEGHLELSRTGRIHMHGYVLFKDIAGFYLVLPKILKKCTIEIDTIADMDYWQSYCTKSSKVLKQYQTKIKQDKGSIKDAKLLFYEGL